MRSRTLIALIIMTSFVASAANAQPAWKRVAKKLRPTSLETPEGEAFINEVPDESDVAIAPEVTDLESSDGSLVPEAGSTIGMMSPDKQINLGKESDESGARKDLFSDSRIRRMLGQAPRFVYDAANRPDPMIFPPVRNAAIYAELSLDAEAMIENEDFLGALSAYQKILELNDRRFSTEMTRKMADLRSAIGAASNIDMPVELVSAELPSWIEDNTNGILYDKNNPMCLIGDYLLGVGETVPTYPEVNIASITPELVIFQIAEEKFEIPVKGYTE